MKNYLPSRGINLSWMTRQRFHDNNINNYIFFPNKCVEEMMCIDNLHASPVLQHVLTVVWCTDFFKTYYYVSF